MTERVGSRYQHFQRIAAQLRAV